MRRDVINVFYKYVSILAVLAVFFGFGLLILVWLTSCSLSVTTLHTQGRASDVVDEAQTITPESNATVNVPLTK